MWLLIVNTESCLLVYMQIRRANLLLASSGQYVTFNIVQQGLTVNLQQTPLFSLPFPWSTLSISNLLVM